jgi:hypothetical protein
MLKKYGTKHFNNMMGRSKQDNVGVEHVLKELNIYSVNKEEKV